MRSLGLAFSLLVGFSAAGPGADRTEPRPRPGNELPYPEVARRIQLAGDVVFVAHVDETGKVTRVDVREVPLRSVGFERAVTEAVTAWRFDPALADGKPSAGEYLGRVTFRVRPDDEALIAAAVAAFAGAWNAGDAAAFARAFMPEGTIRTQVGPSPADTAAIRAWAAARLAAADRPRLRTAAAGIRFWAPDLATARVPLTDGRRDVFLLMASRDGRWLARSLDDAPLVGGPATAYRAGEPGVADPKKVWHVAPVYPEAARAAGVSGAVVLDCVVSPTGEVVEVQVVSGPEPLRAAAADAVRQWRYEPPLVDGRAVRLMITVTVGFSL